MCPHYIGGNNKTIWEMAPEERKITLTCLGIMVAVLLVCIIYYYFKEKKGKQKN